MVFAFLKLAAPCSIANRTGKSATQQALHSSNIAWLIKKINALNQAVDNIIIFQNIMPNNYSLN
jgi:hypothetical protein